MAGTHDYPLVVDMQVRDLFTRGLTTTVETMERLGYIPSPPAEFSKTRRMTPEELLAAEAAMVLAYEERERKLRPF